MRRLALALAVLVFVACESDEAKLSRLQQDQLTKCLVAQGAERLLTTDFPNETPGQQEARVKRARDSETACTLATRELTRFLN